MFNIKDIYVYSTSLPMSFKLQKEFEHLEFCLPEKLKSASSKRQQEYLLGRFCSLMALRKLGFNLYYEVSSDDDGAPIFPEGFVGSITHSHEIVTAVCAKTSSYLGIGIDVQKVMPIKTYKSIKSKILTTFELDLSIEEWSEAEFLTLIFSFKESIYKCLRPLAGRYFGFQDAKITSIDTEKNIIQYELIKTIGNDIKEGHRGYGHFFKSPDYMSTICLEPNNKN